MNTKICNIWENFLLSSNLKKELHIMPLRKLFESYRKHYIYCICLDILLWNGIRGENAEKFFKAFIMMDGKCTVKKNWFMYKKNRIFMGYFFGGEKSAIVRESLRRDLRGRIFEIFAWNIESVERKIRIRIEFNKRSTELIFFRIFFPLSVIVVNTEQCSAIILKKLEDRKSAPWTFISNYVASSLFFLYLSSNVIKILSFTFILWKKKFN